MDEAEHFQKRVAYINTLRGLHRKERLAGFLSVVLGAVLVVPARWVQAWPDAAIWAGYALLALGWVITLYVIWRRTQWRRANPFNPNV